MKPKNENEIIKEYQTGKSMTSIAKEFNTYPITIRRILKSHNVELRHDKKRRGILYVQNGEKLIDWAKAQGRLVTKSELAKIVGTKKLSPAYFIKYPELGQYLQPEIKTEFQEDYKKLYDWLKYNNIPYKPSDRTTLRVSLDALLLEDYSNLAICIAEKPKDVSKKVYEKNLKLKEERALKAGITIIFLKKEDFKDLDKALNKLLELKRK